MIHCDFNVETYYFIFMINLYNKCVKMEILFIRRQILRD